MPVYFQKISNKNFDPEGDFHVKDSKGCNMSMGILFLAAFAVIACIDRFNLADLSVYQVFYLSILPAVYLLRRGMMNKTIMTINKHGFFYFGELVTNWDNFIDAVVTQDEENRRIPYDVTDRFMLMIRYGKIGYPGYYGRKILMTPTMDKAEEEIMAAIKFYYQHKEPGVILPYTPEETPPPPTPRRIEPPRNGKTS